MAEQPRWDLVDLEDGRTWEVRSIGGSRVFGTVGVSELGYTVHDHAGVRYGPFTTLDDAAYALTAWEDQGDRLLIGSPVPGVADSAGPAATSAGRALGAGAAGSQSDQRVLGAIAGATGALVAVLAALTVAAVVVRTRRG